MSTEDRIKPLGSKAYGSIPHLPGSRRGSGDHGLSDQHAALLTVKTRDRHDVVFVQEKLDGSCVSVAKKDGKILPLIRAGYMARGSNYEQHHHFHDWVMVNYDKFDKLLGEGERACGEWLMEAHGTIYKLPHDPFVCFDIMQGTERTPTWTLQDRCHAVSLVFPRLLHSGSALSIPEALKLLEPSGHGAVDGAEGAVWRMERRGVVDFLGKFVKLDKVDGKYFPQISGNPSIFNWRP